MDWFLFSAGMSNATRNETNSLLCPSLPIEITSLPYRSTPTTQIVTLLACIINGISCPVAILNGESFGVHGSFKEAKFTDGLQHLCALSNIYRSSNCNVYSARIHRLSDREVNKRRIRVRSVLYKDCVWVLVCGFVVCDPSAHHTGEICCRVQAVSVSSLCYTGTGNVGHNQWVADMELVQLQSSIFLAWNETQSLFNSIFHLNYVYSTRNHLCLH